MIFFTLFISITKKKSVTILSDILRKDSLLAFVFFSPESKMSTEGQRVDDSPSTSGGSSDGDQREGVQQEQEREQVQPKKKEGKISSKTAAKLSTSAKRIQKELAEITLDPPPNCR
uniref:Ubiquitin conjugating enzyme E2 E2 n=1 Tax=Gopherus agassizii TaxID=38772 RepID=A0A452J1T8_9SAUR